MEKFRLIKSGCKTVICVDRKNRGITRVATAVSRDFQKVTMAKQCDVRVAGTEDPDNGACANADTLIIAGILGTGGHVDQIASEKCIPKDALKGKRETYIFSTMKYKGRNLLLIAGSDRLGTEYGLLRLSELAGVSPWHYWADVEPRYREEVLIDRYILNCTSREPAIKLRGFFINNEWPSLGNWVHSTFGGFNELFYEKVFDLLLRLRGNFLWPAMWTGVFSEDGKAFPTASAELAAELGIIMGTSHHEPLFRAGEEFSHLMTDSNDIGYGKDWNYYTNTRGLYAFWEDAVKRNKDFPSLITIGMRGERDSKILGENATLKDNIDLLKKTITDQKKILSDNGLGGAPKVLALYKEVEDYYYGDNETEGLSKWGTLDDTMLLLSDDNYGNLRTLPAEETRSRKSGWGIYYHLDYHGAPISYEWVNSTPITKIWEQLTIAFEYGIRDLWVVNVGDLRPCELPLSYFMNLAFDYEEWSQPNCADEFLLEWVYQQFGDFTDKETQKIIGKILNEYTRLNGDCRPEATHDDTFSFLEDNEAKMEMERARKIVDLVETVRPKIPQERLDAFYGLVEFPALASANLRQMMIYTGMQKFFAAQKAGYANELREKVLACVKRDKELTRYYNEVMSGGKWNHMMSSRHVAFVNWNDEGSDYPDPKLLKLPEEGEILIAVSGSEEAVSEGSMQLPVFTNTDKRDWTIIIMNTGSKKIQHNIETSDDWICLEEKAVGKGTCKVEVSLNWDMISEDRKGWISISSQGKKVEIQVQVVYVNTEAIPAGNFVEAAGIISMPANCFSNKREPEGSYWVLIENYGKTGVAMKAYPLNKNYTDAGRAPCLEYNFTITNPGQYTVTAYISPANNPVKNRGLYLAIGVDGKAPLIINTLPENYAAGDPADKNWCRYVLENGRRCSMSIELEKGQHTLQYIQIESGVVLQKIEIAKVPSRSFFGYLPTYQKR